MVSILIFRPPRARAKGLDLIWRALGLGRRCNPREVEKIFRQSAEFCSEDESWKLNAASSAFGVAGAGGGGMLGYGKWFDTGPPPRSEQGL